MFQLNPNERLNMKGILTHKWMQGETASTTLIRQEFTARNARNRQEKAKEQKAREAGREHAPPASTPKRAGDGELIPFRPLKTMKEYIQVNENYNTVLLSNHSPDVIEQGIIELLEANEISVTTDKNKYKIKFEHKTSNDLYKLDPKVEF
jgi:hypothetical protein